MSNIFPAYREIAEFLGGLAPAKFLELQPSVEAQARMDALLVKNRDGELSVSEKSELEQYLALENMIALAKVHARLSLSQTS